MFAIDGTESDLESSVVLPLPRKPVTIVTGVFAVSAPVYRHRDVQHRAKRRLQCGVEWVERAADELLGYGPQEAEVLDELGAAFAVAQHVLGPAPGACCAGSRPSPRRL